MFNPQTNSVYAKLKRSYETWKTMFSLSVDNKGF